MSNPSPEIEEQTKRKQIAMAFLCFLPVFAVIASNMATTPAAPSFPPMKVSQPEAKALKPNVDASAEAETTPSVKANPSR